MTDERREELYSYWNEEGLDPEEQDWRDDLTPEELEYVEQLDNNYVTGVRNICSTILIHERIRQRYGPKEIRSLEDLGDHCRLWLRDGTAYLARLTTAGTLRLDPIDMAC